MIILVQTSIVYLFLCTHSQMVGTNKSNVQLFEYKSLSVNVQIFILTSPCSPHWFFDKEGQVTCLILGGFKFTVKPPYSKGCGKFQWPFRTLPFEILLSNLDSTALTLSVPALQRWPLVTKVPFFKKYFATMADYCFV